MANDELQRPLDANSNRIINLATPAADTDATRVTASAPANVTKAAAVVGTAFDAARSDHKHDITTASPGASIDLGDAAAEGTATSLARSDHQHAVSLTFAGPNLTQSGSAIRYDSAKSFALTDAATIVVDASLGCEGQVTLGGNRTMGVPSNPTDAQKFVFRIKQDGTGGRTVTWTTGTGGYLGSLDMPMTEIVLGRAGVNSYDYVGFIYNLALNRWVLMAVNLGVV